MDTIVTPVTVITLDSTRIVHSIKADLVARYFPPVVRLVQYDMSLPVIAVSLMQNGQTYTLPSGAAANIRVHKPDATYVYNPALGCDSTRNIVYFDVTQAMAAASGDGLAIVEIVVNGDIAGTSLITLHFEENPVPEDAIESSDEWETIYELGERIIASTVTPVSTAAGMTDHNVVYLYTGTESGWNQGHMYYYNGTTWVDAGIAVTDTTLSVAGLAADAKKTGDEIATVKDGLNELPKEEKTIEKVINWSNGYITAGGTVRDSSASQYAIVDMHKGETVNVGTNNTNITIIGRTTQSVLSEYDIVEVIQTTGSVATFEEHTYTSNADEKIVICVRASNYTLSFTKDVISVASEKQIEDILQNSYVLIDRPRIINGSLSTTTGQRDYSLSSVNSYVITPDLLHVKAGSKISKSNVTTMRVYEYDDEDNYIGYTQQNTGVNSYVFTSDAYVRLFFLVGNESNVKTLYDNVTFELLVYDYEKPDIIASFMGLNGEKGSTSGYIVSGDACLIQFSNSEVMEIDFHTDDENYTDYYAYRDSLALRGIRYLHYIVFTHWHDDHIGLFEKAINNNVIKIDGATAFLPQLLTSELATARGWETYYTRQNNIISILENHNCTIVYPQDGDTLKIDDAVISWYNCDHGRYNVSGGEYYSTNYNDWSLCFNFRYNNTVVNYSADLGPIGQRAMAGTMPKASILKAMHHGWDNGVNNLIPAFINNVSPDMVCVCNGYAHRPTAGNHEEPNMLNASSPIYSWAEANGVPVYPTVINGNIDVVINSYGYRLDGHYTRFIRNDKNWSYSDNSEHIES